MSKNMFSHLTLTFLLATSFFGFLLIGVLGFKSPSIFQADLPWQKEITGIVYGLICLFGVLAALFPHSCLRIFDFKRRENHTHFQPMTPSAVEQGKDISQTFNVRGHHRMCGNFSSHVFHVGNRTFCASCTGLLIGGLLSLTSAILYFFCNWHIGSGLFLFALGVLGVALNMLSILLFDVQVRHLVRVSLNSFFVFGTFLILVAVNEQAKNLALNLLVIAFSIFWLLTRISLSQWSHDRICDTCDVENCVFKHVRAG